MNRCEAPNCKMRTYALTDEQMRMVKNNYVISFHKFPDDPERRKSWIDAAKKPSWKPPIFNSSLCSLHFRDDCFNENNELYDHAVPSIFFDDFRHHMSEIVEKLDIRYEDDNLKTEIGSVQNTSAESNPSDLQSEIDEDITFLECEEVVVYDDNVNVQLGIENISIPESDEVRVSASKDDRKNTPVPTPKLNSLQINPNNIVDIKISHSDTSQLNSNACEKTLCTKSIEKVGNCSTVSSPISSNLSPKLTSVSSSKTLLSRPSSNLARPSVTTDSNVQSSSNVSNTSDKSIWDYKSTGFSPIPQRTSILPGTASKSSSSSSATPLPSKPVTPQTPGGTFSSRPTILSSSLSSTPAKLSQPSKSANSTPSTLVTNKSTATPNPLASNVSASREKSTPPESDSILEPAAKGLVLQLLNVVKMANSSDTNKPKPGQSFSSYLVTSKCTDTDPNEPCEVMASVEVIDNVGKYIKMIKNETFVKPKNVSIICGSPAIFLLKNITVQECDPNMNSVYVITTEHLVPYLRKMKLKSNPTSTSNKQQQPQPPPAEVPKTNATVQPIKPLLVADLVSSANPKTVVSLQKQLNMVPGQTRVNTPPANSTMKLSTVSKLSNIGEKSANYSISPSSTTTNIAPPHTAKPAASSSLSCTTGLGTSAINSVSRSTAAKSITSSVSCTVVSKQHISNSVSYPTPPKQLTNSVSLTTVSRPLLNNPNSCSTLPKPQTNSVSFTTVSRPPLNNPKSSPTLAKPLTNSVSYTATPGPPVKYSNFCPPPLSPLTNSVSHSAGFRHSVNNSISHSVPTKPTANLSTSSTSTSVANSTPAKPSAGGLISGYRTLHEHAVAAFFNPNPPRTSTYPPTSTIGRSITKTTSPVTPATKILPPMPDTPVARVIPTTVGATITSRSPASNSLAAPTNVLAGSVNIRQNTQPALHRTTSTQPTRQIISVLSPRPTPTITTTRAAAPVPPSSSVSISSVGRSQQPKPIKTPLTKPCSLSNSIPSQAKPSASSSVPSDYIFKPIQLSSFDTNLKTTELLITYDSIMPTKPSTSAIASQSTVIPPLKRKWREIDDEDDDDDDDDDDDPFFATCNDDDYNQQYIEHQKKEIDKYESNILQKEREISNLKKRIQALKKRLSAVRNPNDSKTDEQLVEEILSKYIDSDGMQFFIGQMKVAGKTYTQFRWSEDDKLFALGLLYRNPAEYNTLFQKYTLPSDKTLSKFVNRVKKTEMQDSRTTSSKYC